MDPVAAAGTAVAAWLAGRRPDIAIVLGSGLGGLAATLEQADRLSYDQIPGFPAVGVQGHAGELVCGRLAGRTVLCQAGRFHGYEGHLPSVLALPARVFARAGVRALLLTNAAGGLRPALPPGSLMLVADQLNLTFRNPLAGPVRDGEARFPDMSAPFDPRLAAIAREVARAEGIPLGEGVYAGVLGPSYETPAEIRMLARLGADAVGMSTVPEVIVARHAGMRVLGLSGISNKANLDGSTVTTHEEVMEAGKVITPQMETIIRGVLRGL